MKDLLDGDGNPKASGDTTEAIVVRLLDHMWAESKKPSAPSASPEHQEPPPSKKPKVEATIEPASSPDGDDSFSDDEDDSIEVLTPTSRPRNWMFKGYMAFMYFGPYAENREAGRYIDLLQLTDPPKKEQKKALSRGRSICTPPLGEQTREPACSKPKEP